MVSTHLKNIRQNGNLPQIRVKIKKMWNHHPVIYQLLQDLGNTQVAKRCEVVVEHTNSNHFQVKICAGQKTSWNHLHKKNERARGKKMKKNGSETTPAFFETSWNLFFYCLVRKHLLYIIISYPSYQMSIFRNNRIGWSNVAVRIGGFSRKHL